MRKISYLVVKTNGLVRAEGCPLLWLQARRVQCSRIKTAMMPHIEAAK